MKRLIALVTGALVATAMTLAPAPESSAGTVAIPGLPPGTTVTLTIPDMLWTDNTGCQFAEAQYAKTIVVVAGTSVNDWWLSGEVRYQPDDRYASDMWASGRGTGTFVNPRAIAMCADRERNGTYLVTGQVEVNLNPSEVGLWVSAPFSTTFTVSAMPTTTSLAKPTVIGALTTFSGQVLATSASKGAIGADRSAQVSIESLVNTAWTRIGIGSLDTAGSFAIPVPVVLSPGTQFRATYPGTTTSAASTSPVQVVPATTLPSPTVKVKAVSSRSKLKVDVNPNMGRKYWTFQVQRKNADGTTWKPLKTYKTYGSAEKRTINLPKGTYKVFVNPKFGYQGATSAEITLKR